MEVVVGDYKFKFVKWASISVHKRYTKVQRIFLQLWMFKGKRCFPGGGDPFTNFHEYLLVYFTSTPAPGVKIRKSSDAYNKTACQSLLCKQTNFDGAKYHHANIRKQVEIDVDLCTYR